VGIESKNLFAFGFWEMLILAFLRLLLVINNLRLGYYNSILLQKAKSIMQIKLSFIQNKEIFLSFSAFSIKNVSF